MARRKKQFGDAAVAALKPKVRRGLLVRHAYPDTDQRGLYIRVTPKGTKSFVAVAIGLDGKQVWHTIGGVEVGIDKARGAAREIIGRIKTGESREDPQSFRAVSDDWFKRHVIAKALRCAKDYRRSLDNNILPSLGARKFTAIRRGEIAKLLDKIEDDRGPVAADRALAIVSAICSWYATRHDDYASPIVRGMRRSNPVERARERTITDDEVRAIWKQAEANGTFGALVRSLLLTGQRLEKVATMKWNDISSDGTWTIATEAREKGNAVELKLPEIVLDLIRSRPRIDGNPYVFAGRGNSHYCGFSKGKAAFDAKLKDKGAVTPEWRLHDLRRTARSLMSRAGVSGDHAERVLGHSIKGVEGVYDRHSYAPEKAEALRKLAGLIGRILRGPVENVVSIAG